MESWELRYPLVTWPGKHLNHAEEKGCNKNYDDYFNLSSITSYQIHGLCIAFQTEFAYISLHFETLSILHHLLFTQTNKILFCRTIIIPLRRSPYINTKLFNITLMMSGHRPAPGLKTYSVPDLTKTSRPTLYISLQTLIDVVILRYARSFQRASSQTNG